MQIWSEGGVCDVSRLRFRPRRREFQITNVGSRLKESGATAFYGQLLHRVSAFLSRLFVLV